MLARAWDKDYVDPGETKLPDFPLVNPKTAKYLKEIKPGVLVDVYDVLWAWKVVNPALQHLIKKALQAGARGHKDLLEDLDDIVVSANRAKGLITNEQN